jgi:hypothetical protein
MGEMPSRFGLGVCFVAALSSSALAKDECAGHKFLEKPRADTSCQLLKPEIFVSPDGSMRVAVLPVGVSLNATPDMENRVVIHTSEGDTRSSKSYASPQGEHGYYVVAGKWSPDSQFFAYSLTSSGGHQPWSFPIVVYGRKANAFAKFSDMIKGEPTVSGKLEFTGPHTLTAMTWKSQGDLDHSVPISVDLEKAFEELKPEEEYPGTEPPKR